MAVKFFIVKKDKIENADKNIIDIDPYSPKILIPRLTCVLDNQLDEWLESISSIVNHLAGY